MSLSTRYDEQPPATSSPLYNGQGLARPAGRSRLDIDGNRLVGVLTTAAAVVITLGWLREAYVAVYGVEGILKNLRHFAFDSEHSAPAWFSSLNLLLAAGLIAVIAVFARRDRDRDWRRWALLCVIFATMAIDEAVAFHEILITPLREGLGVSGIFFFAWVIPGAVVVAALGAAYVPFLVRLPWMHARRFIVSGAIFVGGALGLEMIGGALAAADGGSLTSLPYLVVASLEETMEIIGITIFNGSLLAYLRDRWQIWELRIA